MSFIDNLIRLKLNLLATGDKNQLTVLTPVFEWWNRTEKL